VTTSMPIIPVFFTDLGKAATDLLTKDFPVSNKLELTAKAPNGVEYTVNATSAKDGNVVGTLKPKFVYSPYGLTAEGTLETSKNYKGELSIQDHFVKGLKVSVVGEVSAKHQETVKLSLDYKQDRIAAILGGEVLNTQEGPSIFGSVVLGHDHFSLGGDFALGVEHQQIKRLNGSLEYQIPECSLTVSTNKGENVGLKYYHRISSSLQAGVDINVNVAKPQENPKLTFGGAYKIDSESSFKAKFDTEGKLSVGYLHQLNRYAKLTGGMQLNTNNFSAPDHKFGFNLVFTAE